MKDEAVKLKLIEELKKVPIIQIACRGVGVDKSTYYRWLKTDSKFKSAVGLASKEGIEVVNDVTESQLIKRIKAGDAWAIKFWLTNRHKSYMPIHRQLLTIEPNQELTSEQMVAFIVALKQAAKIIPNTALPDLYEKTNQKNGTDAMGD